MSSPLPKPLRTQLESTVKSARDLAEQAARAALAQLAVGEAKAPDYLTADLKALRRRLRAHGRALGDVKQQDDTQEVRRLVWEAAYEHWHRMLFARFLAENGLLLWEPGAPVSLDDCRDMVDHHPELALGAKSQWELAGRLAARMLPQVFKPHSPAFELTFAPEHQRALERLLADLTAEVFQASDSLGWVYQFWQAKRKDEVNASEVKIGADELPAVTQLFTESYMVDFLLHNSLGAWWAARRLSPDDLCDAETEDALRRKVAIPGVPLEYLRFVRAPACDCDYVVRASSPDDSHAAGTDSSGQDGLTTIRMDEQTLAIGHGEHLPHWTCNGAVYHIVCRLADAIPQSKLDQWAAPLSREEPGQQTDQAQQEARYRRFKEIDTWLDSGYGASHLRQPAIAEIVANALKYFDGDRYRLHAWCVMPNHVHVIVEPLGDNPLSKIIHSWKSFTANAINRRLGLSGALWQADAYNHIIRTHKEYEYQVRYVWHNPDKANIPNWPWRWTADCVVRASSPDDPPAAGTQSSGQDGLTTQGACAYVVRASSPDDPQAARTELSGQDGLTTQNTASACAYAGVVRASSPDNPQAAGTESSGQDGLTTQQPRCWTPAAGAFEGWPDTLKAFKLLDPCCGSGHFLVAAFLLLVPMRMAAEGLNARDAVDAVLADNLHGLELDARCVEIAVFALALAAWRFPDEHGDPLGVRADMPAPNIACCGLKVAASAKDWEALVPDSQPNAALLRQELRLLHAGFAQAPLLGSLLDPARSLKDDLFKSSFDDLKGLLELALAAETPTTRWGTGQELNDDAWDLALTARGLLDAARLLDARYHLVITNVPYLARGKQHEALKAYCDTHYPESKTDLATVFLERGIELCVANGSLAVVSPQNWWFLGGYQKFRVTLLELVSIELLVALGEEAWQHFGDRGPLATLTLISKRKPSSAQMASGIDTLLRKSIEEKAELLRSQGPPQRLLQAGLRANPDSRIAFVEITAELLSKHADSFKGMSTGDLNRFIHEFWEVPGKDADWVNFQGTPEESCLHGGRSQILRWEGGTGDMVQQPSCYVKGGRAWGRKGVFLSQMRSLAATLYEGQHFDENGAAIVPDSPENIAAIFTFLSSPEYRVAVKAIDAAVKVTNKTLIKVPFDLDRWKSAAQKIYPHGLPKPYSDDPTQWLFHGHPQPATDPLQVAAARLLGYRWPAETDAEMELSDEARAWITRCEALAGHVDDDGIVCLSCVRGEPPAHDRLLALLIAAWETVEPGSWRPSILAKLLADSDCAGKDLEVWLRDKFFAQHARRFQHRPFIWHVWDGLKDGFGALVNYHRLNARNLERLIHTYLGDWIRQQEAGVRDAVDGAQTRLAAAQDLKRRLELILEGEFDGKVGYDIFVRWKPLSEQPSGWNPDLNDGVRMNIRPFMTAGVLRHNKKPKLNIGWDKDRGKDVASAPWYAVFKGERINDHHLTLAEKAATRGASS
ncbi:DNA methyltransferase [uncultured Thiodictyon sp.]|uniref:Eco57I restriction-modification methylase domain-containing protein n=1 Tax=uncultured Thiodictyon sp. TaxID=1846217 RepID=UPI0025DEE906|nr:DNA methyltransferase [uncultured Thiodictyon sp.]